MVQPALILFDRQQVVGSPVQNPLGNLLLAPHGINGYYAPMQLQQLQQPGMAVISLDFSSVFTCPRVRVLAEAQALTRWMGCLPARLSWERRTVLPSMATTSPGQQIGHRLAPLHEALLEPVRVQAGEHIAEGVVRRDSVGQSKKVRNHSFLALAEHLHVNPRVRATDDGADGYGDDVQQLVLLAPVDPRVFQSPEILHDGRAPSLLYHSHLTFQTLGLPSNDKPTIYNAIALPWTPCASIWASRLTTRCGIYLAVHNRGGQPCPRCGAAITELKANQRITSYCRQCQPGMLLRN